MTIRIATWNINSVRLRLPLLQQLTAQHAPDIVCLQETKVEDAHFPFEALKALGFDHVYFSGQKSYNGVAILSRLPLRDVRSSTIAGMEHKRHISATLPDGSGLHNFYVPAGGDIPDPEQNPAFAFKLRFVEEMADWSQEAKRSKQPLIILGDFNIAPLEHDVWSHKQLLNIVSHTPAEVERLTKLQATQNWCDVARHFTDHGQKLYSWWSYRNRDWRKSDRGRRLDHIWVTPALVPALRHCTIIKDWRDSASPSDHVPVMVDIALKTA